MVQIPPTTAYDLQPGDDSPCCNAPLVLSSPPNWYECRECMEEYDLGDGADALGEQPDTCQVEKADGETCGRDRPCRYHD